MRIRTLVVTTVTIFVITMLFVTTTGREVLKFSGIAISTLIAMLGVALVAVILASKISSRSSASASDANDKKKWHENLSVLSSVGVALYLIYGITRLELHKNEENWKTIGFLIFGCIVISILIKAYRLPGKAGIWAAFIFACIIVTFDFANLILTATGFIDTPVISLEGFVSLFEGNYTMLGIISLIALIALSVKVYKELAAIALIALISILANYSIIDQKSKNLFASMKKSAQAEALDLPLSAYPEKYVLLNETGNFISTKENQQKVLPCEVSGCLVQVTGHYLDRVKKGQAPVIFSPAGNCDVHPRGKSLAELPPYRGKKPCYGALMYSFDGGTSFQGILPESDETITSDEVTRQIGLVKSDQIVFKFFIGNQSNGFGQGFIVSTHRPTSPKTI